jgi:hypothetical protein
MADEPLATKAGEGLEDEARPGLPERPRLPLVSLAITALFLALGGLLLYFVRADIGYFFSGKAPAVRFVPTRLQPVPPDAPSNAMAEVRVDYQQLCDYWDATLDPFPPEVSYAFTLEMGWGKRYFLTCVGDGTVRPRLWILRPETEAETKEIHLAAIRGRLSQSTLASSTEEQVPEVHVPGGSGCVNDLCRGRLVRFGEYAQNPLGGVRQVQEVLRDRLEPEFRRLGRAPLEDGDFLIILGETPSTRWWYVALLGGILLLTLANLLLGLRSLRRFLRARRIVDEYLRRVGSDAPGGKGATK